MVPGTQGRGAIYCLQCKLLSGWWYGIYQHDLRGNNVRVCLMAAGTEPKIKGIGQLLPINAVINGGASYSCLCNRRGEMLNRFD